ncbi:putative transcription factor MYB/SANT family [Medicago truncatula]|nr:putative transcription factor MYB/SANT family [Medicago truncatula]
MEHVSHEGLDLSPRIGHAYQAEIPSVLKKSEQLSLRMNPTDSESVHDKSLSFAIGLPIPVTWIPNEECGYRGDINSCQLAPGRLSSSWSDADTKSFLLGLFIFGKNFMQIKRFLDNKRMGEILSFYYGKFYKTDGYRRWSECRKKKGGKRMIGQKLFSGPRQHELLSRLITHVSEESQDTLSQVSKSYVEGRTSLEEYISSLKSIVGVGVLVEAVGIGKEKGDLTRLGVEPVKNSRKAFLAPTCKALSSLGLSDIIQSLTGGFRLSKTKCNDLFWEAVWPRLLARGWHSEQPKNRGYITSKDYLVFLIPGVEKFSRRKLVKGHHYFDSVSDVLSKVAAEPNILVLEEEAEVGSCNEEGPEKGSNEDDVSDDHRQCYLKPRSSTYNNDRIKFMVIDTSLVRGGNPSDLRELKSMPVNSVSKVDVDAAGKKYKGRKYTRKVNHSTDMSKIPEQNATTLTVIDTNRPSDGKVLKLKVKQLKSPPVELEDAPTTTTGLRRESKGGSSTYDSAKMVEPKRLICGKKKINKTDSHRGVSNSGAISKIQANDNDANKMVENQTNQHACEFDDNRLKRIIKHQFNRRVRSGDSNNTVVPIKRRRLTACAKEEKSRIVENSSGGLGSDNLGFSPSSRFRVANPIVCDPISHQQSQSSPASSEDRSLEEDDNVKRIHNDSNQCVRVSSAKDAKCESFSFNVPQVLSNSENCKIMATVEEGEQRLKEKDPCLTAATQEVVELPLRTDVGYLEKQPDINPRRQSTRNRPLTVRALECIANEYLHVQKRQKKKDIQTHEDPFNPCCSAQTKGKSIHHCSDHGNSVLAQEEKHLIGDRSVS